MDLVIQSLGPEEARARERELVDILVDCVDGGASVGFLPPLGAAEAAGYWRTVADAVSEGARVLLVAGPPDAPASGTVQLDLCTRANGLHRAEVVRLLVHRRARRQGIGRALVVPHYARSASGALDPSAFYYKLLDAPPTR